MSLFSPIQYFATWTSPNGDILPLWVYRKIMYLISIDVTCPYAGDFSSIHHALSEYGIKVDDDILEFAVLDNWFLTEEEAEMLERLPESEMSPPCAPFAPELRFYESLLPYPTMDPRPVSDRAETLRMKLNSASPRALASSNTNPSLHEPFNPRTHFPTTDSQQDNLPHDLMLTKPSTDKELVSDLIFTPPAIGPILTSPTNLPPPPSKHITSRDEWHDEILDFTPIQTLMKDRCDCNSCFADDELSEYECQNCDCDPFFCVCYEYLTEEDMDAMDLDSGAQDSKLYQDVLYQEVRFEKTPPGPSDLLARRSMPPLKVVLPNSVRNLSRHNVFPDIESGLWSGKQHEEFSP